MEELEDGQRRAADLRARLARVFRLPGLRLDPERPSRPHGHEFRAPPGVWVVWDED